MNFKSFSSFFKNNLYKRSVKKFLWKNSVSSEQFLRNLGSEPISGNWKSFKNDEICFLFHLESPLLS